MTDGTHEDESETNGDVADTTSSITGANDPRFKLTRFVVEANSFETLELWRECKKDGISWEQDCSGLLVNVGELDDRPINMSVTWQTVNGMKMLFWEACSQLVDYKMIDNWFKKNCLPMYMDSPQVAKTGASNFHHALHEAKRQSEVQP